MTSPNASGPAVHYPSGVLGSAHPGAVEDCRNLLCVQKREAGVTADTTLRERIAAAARAVPIRLGPNALAMAQRGEPIILNYGEADALAAALLPLFAAERAAGRRDGLDEGAAALQEVIDRAQFPHARGQSRIALGGARQILLGLLNDPAAEEATGPDADTTGDCPGYETAPNRCTCECEGCQHNCAAHHGQEAGLPLDPQGHTSRCADAPGIRGLLEHVGIDTTGRDISISGNTADAAAHDSADARADATGEQA